MSIATPSSSAYNRQHVHIATAPHQYPLAVRCVLIGIMLLNLIVTAIKFFVGALTGSIAVIADAFNALVVSSSNVIGLLGLRAASEPPDADRPYGRRKYKTIATLAIAGLMLLAG